MEPSFWYSMFGLQVGSDVRLPLAPILGSRDTTPAWVVRRMASGNSPVPDGAMVDQTWCDTACNRHVVAQVHRGPGGAWFWHYLVGTCHAMGDARRVDAYPSRGADERALGLLLAGQVSVFMLHQLGTPSLHASAVITPGGAVAFFGPKGQGKSTMAAAFLRGGATLLTDDILPLRLIDGAIYGGPGLPIMKVWRETAESTLGLSDELPNLTEDFEKKLLILNGRYAFAQGPALLRAMYVLDRYDPLAVGQTDVAIRALTKSESLRALFAQISYGAFLQPSDGARFLPLYTRLLAQAPVHVLSYPQGFEHQDQLRTRIMAELGNQTP